DRRRLEARIRAASLRDPDAAAVLVDLDCARRSPRAALRQLEVPLDGTIRVRQIVRRLDIALGRGEQTRVHDDRREPCNRNGSLHDETSMRQLPVSRFTAAPL